MESIEGLQLLEDIKNCEENIKAAKEMLKNVEETLYQEEQFLIIHKNKLEKLKDKK